jgi:hypothetical protein
MSRKALALSLVLVAGLLWPVAVLAANPNPNTCLPTCYAWNQAPSGGNGTRMSPWRWDKASDPNALKLRDPVKAAVKGSKYMFGTLQVIDCNDAKPPQCVATLYTVNRAGEWAQMDLGPVPVPEVGVPLPFHYILGLVALVALLLVGAGLLLRRRAHLTT